MTMRTLPFSTLPLAILLAAPALALALEPPADTKTLWVSDDVNATIYHVLLDGTVLSSFHSGSISEVALDDTEPGTLWGAKEGSNLIVHFSKSGQTLSSFPGTVYDPAAFAPEGVAVDLADGTLWIADDVTDLIYHVERDGSPLESFSTALFDPAAISPQGLATDPTDGTLWVADNVTHRVYNLTTSGALVASFPAAAFGPATLNLQGIAIDGQDHSVWLTARNTHTIYNVSREGALQSTLDAALFGSLDPTGVEAEPLGPWTDLGHALAGSTGAPLLVGTGTLAPSTPAALVLTNARPNAQALLIIGLSALNAPFKGGVLVPALDAITQLATGASGAITLSTTWPPALPGGTQIWVQWWISDSTGPSGFAASNALLATTPAP
jgi:DNA-binding beta-propeller fold protein YncE